MVAKICCVSAKNLRRLIHVDDYILGWNHQPCCVWFVSAVLKVSMPGRAVKSVRSCAFFRWHKHFTRCDPDDLPTGSVYLSLLMRRTSHISTIYWWEKHIYHTIMDQKKKLDPIFIISSCYKNILVRTSHTLWLCQNSYWKWPSRNSGCSH